MRCYVDDVFNKLRMLQFNLPNETMSITDILKFIKLVYCYPNVSFAYRISLIVSMFVTSAKISFLKLNLIKIYLR